MEFVYVLSSKHEPNFNTMVGFYVKMNLHHHHPPHKLNVSNISAVTDPIWMKL